MNTIIIIGKHYVKGKPRVWRSNVDYVLLQSGKSMSKTHLI